MTVIAYRDGVMAADTRGYSGDRPRLGRRRKIHLFEPGVLLGISSNQVGQSDCFLEWLSLKEDPGVLHERLAHFKRPSFSALLVKADGTVSLYDDSAWPTVAHDVDFFAIGSGDFFALGAMAHGATAVEAVQAAIRLDPWSGMPVRALNHEGREWFIPDD